jgi:hypothetical protein
MKVLLISHNPITTYQNMGKTFLSLFSEFSREEICQLYIYPTIPDVDVCHSYYRITDRNVFESYWHLGKVNGREITINDIDTTKHDLYENEREESFIKVKKTALKSLIRDFVWKHSRWYSLSLVQWIEKERPTCIFLAPGEAKFIYDVALKIAKEYNLPIITYICDEFYFIDKTEGVIDRFRLYLLKNKIRQLMQSTSEIISICEEISKQYFSKFGVGTHTIMTGASITVAESPHVKLKMSEIVYLGNLAYDRVSSLIDVGKAIDVFNVKHNLSIKLKLYTRSMSTNTKQLLQSIRSIEYCGYVTGKEFISTLLNADALLHVESFSDIYIERVKNSISTKIADSLASGNPLIAYAPDRIASVKYLETNNAALVIKKKSLLINKLEEFILNDALRKEIAYNGIMLAKEKHIAFKNSKLLHSICLKYSQ